MADGFIVRSDIRVQSNDISSESSQAFWQKSCPTPDVQHTHSLEREPVIFGADEFPQELNAMAII